MRVAETEGQAKIDDLTEEQAKDLLHELRNILWLHLGKWEPNDFAQGLTTEAAEDLVGAFTDRRLNPPQFAFGSPAACPWCGAEGQFAREEPGNEGVAEVWCCTAKPQAHRWWAVYLFSHIAAAD